ncbi:MAG: PIN domain-containing protein [Candidatus Methanomethylicaceae archaeon]|nr:PIN domain-containing protein [Candidatus Verstraetearchaeota archaeon]
MSERLTFDSEAILAFYLGEEGGEIVRDCLIKVQNGDAEGYVNVINLTEIYYILYRVDPRLAEEKQRKLRLYGLKIVPINNDSLWREAAKIKGKYTLSLADAFAAATAIVLKSKLVVGSDRDFRELNVQLLKIRD